MRCHLRQVILLGISACLIVIVTIQVVNQDGKQASLRDLPWGRSFHDDTKHIHGDGVVVDGPSASTVANVSHVHRAPHLHAPEAPMAKVWPDPDNVQDRILTQLFDPYNLPTISKKKLLVYNGGRNTPAGDKVFKENQCGVQHCEITTNNKELATADAVLFQGSALPSKKLKRPEQIWVVSTLESPHHSRGLAGYHDVINWTATYRRDSVIVSPYERFVPFKNATKLPDAPQRDYAEGKNEKVAWFVSNCNAINGRLQYVKQLSKHIPVHIYGPCGEYKCPRSKANKCFEMLNKKYKFYLAFENSNCRDYITEKFYWNGLWNDVVPVVMGAAPEDYQAVAPPFSYIHVDDFDGPEELAKFLHSVDKNDTVYNSYFRWKGTGEFLNTKFMCRMCRMMHEADHHRMSYHNVDDWWRGKGVCVTPAKRPWASWREHPDRAKFFGVAKNNTWHHDPL